MISAFHGKPLMAALQGVLNEKEVKKEKETIICSSINVHKY